MDGSTNLVLDTNIILYGAVYNDVVAIDLIRENDVFISDITEIELLGYHQLTDEEQAILTEIISHLNVVPINGVIKKMAIELRRKYALKTPDAIIMATAKSLNYSLVTADKKLKQVEEVNIIDYEAP